MKKKILAMMGLCALCGGAMSQTVTVADVNARPGETVAFSLNLSDGKAATYTALSFDVQFPESGFTTTGTYKVSDAWTGAMAVVGDVDATGLATIPFASAETITGSDVENLVSVSFKVDESIELGTYDVTLKNILFEYGMSDKDNAPDVTFHVNVSSSILLDEASATMPEAATGVDVRVLRTIKADEWSTICLPFAMTEEQVTAAFGSDVKLGDFTGYATEEDDDANIVGITVNFDAVSAIDANHPYVIKTSQDITEFSVSSVDIDAEEEPTVAAVKRTKKQWSEMIGTNNAKTVTEMENCLFLSGGKFWYAKGDKEFKAFRGYFDFYDVITSVEEAGARISISFDGHVTGIEDRMVMKGDGRYYNLRGQHVEHPSKGVYITNGKKVVVK